MTVPEKMKSIKISVISREVQKLIAKASFNLPPDITNALKLAKDMETSPRARKIMELIIDTSAAASREKLPLSKD